MGDANHVKLSVDIAGQKMERVFEGMPLEDWPAVRQPTSDTAPLSKEVFNRIKLALPAASKDASRRVITGVLLEKDGITATDGKHLVRFKQDVPVTQQVILPPTKVLLSGMLNCDGGFGVTVEDKTTTHVHFNSGNWRYTVKCIEGSYPNYRHIIPSEECLRSKIVFTSEDAVMLRKSLPMLDKLENDLNGVVLYAGSLGVKFLSCKTAGDVKIETKAEYKGWQKEMVACANRDYLLRAFELGFTELRFSDACSPFVFKGEAGLYVFMPIRNVKDMDVYWKKLGLTFNQEENMSEKKTETAVNLNKEEKQMNERTAETVTQTAAATVQQAVEQKPPFQVVGGKLESGDVYDEALSTIETIKASIKAVYDGAADLQRKLRDAQKAIKNKEREYQSTKQLITRLRTASGF
jgi:DNA polymerase III sliding clamp (beta) subunit (PCNA family)